jgi:hypothetical protein
MAGQGQGTRCPPREGGGGAAGGPCIPRSLSSPGSPRPQEGYVRTPGLFPAPLADMAADELSLSLLGSPAARVD